MLGPGSWRARQSKKPEWTDCELCAKVAAVARPQPPPWGALITSAINRAGLSARSAARQAGISEGRWRQLTSGYQVVSPGVYAPVHGPAPTLARMATVAGLSARQLQEAGREDVAAILTRQRERSAAEGDFIERVRAMDTDQILELLATIALRLGVSLPAAVEESRL